MANLALHNDPCLVLFWISFVVLFVFSLCSCVVSVSSVWKPQHTGSAEQLSVVRCWPASALLSPQKSFKIYSCGSGCSHSWEQWVHSVSATDEVTMFCPHHTHTRCQKPQAGKVRKEISFSCALVSLVFFLWQMTVREGGQQPRSKTAILGLG